MQVYYRGSPELGYASRDQMIEYTQSKANPHSPSSVELARHLGKRVFNKMRIASMVATYAWGVEKLQFLPDLTHALDADAEANIIRNEGEIKMFHGKDTLGDGIDFEAGIGHPEIGVLVNLDYLNVLLNEGSYVGGQRVEISGLSGTIIRNYINERRQLMQPASNE